MNMKEIVALVGTAVALVTLSVLGILSVLSVHASERDYNATFCAGIVKGQTEVQHPYTFPGGEGSVIVDCETKETVYECGLDTRSSLDSVQQALFFAYVTGKQPAIVLFDTNGELGKYEHRIRVAAERAGVLFYVVPVGPLLKEEEL